MIHRFTPAELAAIKRRNDAVLGLLSTIAELNGITGDVEVSADGMGFIRPGDTSPVITPKQDFSMAQSTQGAVAPGRMEDADDSNH